MPHLLKYVLPLIFVPLIFSACGSDEDKDGNRDDQEQVQTGDLPGGPLSVLPYATTPVGASASLMNRLSPLATTGTSLGSGTSSNSFSQENARGLCESINSGRTFLHLAAKADVALCELRAITKDGLDVADGSTHILEFTDAYLDHVKLSVTKSGSTITGLTYFGCRNGEQVLYIKQDITGTDYTMTVVGKGEDSYTDIDYQYAVEVGATVDAQGVMSGTKTLAFDFINNFNSSGTSNYKLGTSTQTDSEFTYTHYEKNYSGLNHSGSVTQEGGIYLLGEMIQPAGTKANNYNLREFAIGDGAGYWGETDRYHGWNGDTKALDFSNSYYNTLDSGTPSSLVESDTGIPTISFSGVQAYSCDGTVDATISESDLDPLVDHCEGNLTLPQSDHLSCSNMRD